MRTLTYARAHAHTVQYNDYDVSGGGDDDFSDNNSNNKTEILSKKNI